MPCDSFRLLKFHVAVIYLSSPCPEDTQGFRKILQDLTDDSVTKPSTTSSSRRPAYGPWRNRRAHELWEWKTSWFKYGMYNVVANTLRAEGMAFFNISTLIVGQLELQKRVLFPFRKKKVVLHIVSLWRNLITWPAWLLLVIILKIQEFEIRN